MALTARIKIQAEALGFAGAAVLPVGPSLTHPFYEEWLKRGFAGEMAYLKRHAALKKDLAALAPGAVSAILVTLNYNRPAAPPPRGVLAGRVSRYAWGGDYHEVIATKLGALAAFIEKEAGRPVRSWSYVDSAPVMEREFAARAGLGWIGKHGVLIHWRLGSWLFVGELLVDLVLDYDGPRAPARRRAGGREPSPAPETAPGTAPGPARSPHPPTLDMRESCGSCTACIQACPTDAIVAEKTVDSRRCISYHTIELKGPIPTEFREALGEWVFGCDICQDVCPWNRKAPLGNATDLAKKPAEQPAAAAGRAYPSLRALLALDEGSFQEQFRGTALLRTKRRGLARNAAIVLGNRLAALAANGEGERERAGDGIGGADTEKLFEGGVAALAGALEDSEPLVRGAAAWALGRAGGALAAELLRRALHAENDATVRAELEAALEKTRGKTQGKTRGET